MLDDPGNTTLPALAVDPDNGFVGAVDVLGVNRKIRHLPWIRGLSVKGLTRAEAFVDGILVGATESTDNQLAAVWMPLVDWDLVAPFDHLNDVVYIGEVDLRVDPLGV